MLEDMASSRSRPWVSDSSRAPSKTSETKETQRSWDATCKRRSAYDQGGARASESGQGAQPGFNEGPVPKAAREAVRWCKTRRGTGDRAGGL